MAGVREDASTFEHVDPAMVGNQRDLLISELSGRGTVTEKAAAASIGLDEAGAARLTERVKELEHAGYHFEAADGSFELLMRKEAGEYEPLFRLESWRCIVEKRADGKVETEATIKIWVNGERYVRTAEGNGPVHALDRALRDAIGEIHPHLKDIELVNFKVRILDETKGTDAVTRVLLDASDGLGVVGLDRGQREHHRRLLGGARGLARVRRAAGSHARVIPLAKPVIGAREEELVLEVLRSGQLSLGPRVPAFEQAFAARVGAPHASAVSSGTTGLHLALRAVGVGEGDEVVTSPFSFVASANAVLYERARPVFADIDPVTLNLDPEAARGGGDRAHDRAAARPHLRLPGRPAGVRVLRPADRGGRLRGAGRGPSRRHGGRRPRPPGGVRLLRQQAADDRRGRDGHARRRRA